MGRSRWLAVAVALAWASPGDPLGEARARRAGTRRVIVSGVSLPNGVMARPDAANPILNGKNLYAPDLVRNGESWNMYYGGWRDRADLNDRIFAAVCAGPAPAGPWAGGGVVVDHGDYLHVNDPSVQKRGPADWWMAYTVADRVGDRAWIGIAPSRDGMNFTPPIASPRTEIILEGANFTSAARPALLWTGSAWKMWFDGKVAGGPTHCYLAQCADDTPKRFRLVREYPDVDNFPGFQEPDVSLIGGVYVAVIQRKFRELRKLVSRDGIHFEDAGLIVSSADPAFGRRRLSNPGWIDDGGGKLLGVTFGMTDSKDLLDHSIGVAYHQYAVKVGSPGGVAHVYGHSRGPDVAVPMTFGFAAFDGLTVLDPATKGAVAEAGVAPRPGDRWRLILDGPRPAAGR